MLQMTPPSARTAAPLIATACVLAAMAMIAMATACAKLEHALHSAIETYYRMKRSVTQIIRVVARK
jgi:hypothetical protein